MVFLDRAPAWALLIAAIAVCSACKSSKNKGGVVETPAPEPVAFTDSFGEMWTCVEAEESGSVAGRVSFTRPVNLNRADLLHISLLKIDTEGQTELVATTCLNNMLNQPIPYQIAYNPELVDPAARYVLSSVLFSHLEGETFAAAYKPDGFLEVINNGLVSQANISLKVP